jgi:uncharacterized phage-associated protein
VIIWFKTNPDKALEAVMWFLNKRPQIDRYILYSLLFLADKQHVNWAARPITSDNYVVKDSNLYPDLISKLIDQGIEIREPNLDLLSQSDIDVCSEVLDSYGAWSLERLREITMSTVAYQRAMKKKRSKPRQRVCYGNMLEGDMATKEAREELSYCARHALI